MNRFANFFILISLGILAPLCWSADTLLQIYKVSLRNDSELLAAQAEYLAKTESKNINRAALLPNIDAIGTYSENEWKGSSTSVLGQSSIFGRKGNTDQDKKSYSITLSQPIFNLPAWFSFQQGKELSYEAQLQFSANQQSFILRCADTYYGVLRARETLESTIAEEEAIKDQLDQAKKRFEVGLTPITEIHETKAAYDNAQVKSLEATAALDIAFEGLTVLTGQPHEKLVGLATGFPIIKPEPLGREAWVQFALANNFSLKAARHARDAAAQNAKSKKYEHLPKLTGSISYYDDRSDSYFMGTDLQTNTTFSSPSESSSLGYSTGVEISVPIFTGGLISAERRQAMQQSLQLKAVWVGKKRSIAQQTKSQHLQVFTNVARVQAREQAVGSAKSVLTSTEESYEAGTRNIADVLIAQRSLYQAKRDYADSRYDYIDSLLRLKEVSGQLSPKDLIELNNWLDPEIIVMKSAHQ